MRISKTAKVLCIIAKWEWMYERLVKFLRLKFIDIDESWPYHVFQKKLEICYAAQIGGSKMIISCHFQLK